MRAITVRRRRDPDAYARAYILGGFLRTLTLPKLVARSPGKP